MLVVTGAGDSVVLKPEVSLLVRSLGFREVGFSTYPALKWLYSVSQEFQNDFSCAFGTFLVVEILRLYGFYISVCV